MIFLIPTKRTNSNSPRAMGNLGRSLTAVILALFLLPRHLQAMDVFHTAIGENAEDATPSHGSAGSAWNVPDVQQTLNQLMQRFATMEVSIETRLRRLTDSTAKGDALLESLSKRLGKVDSLIEKVEALDTRLTEETSYLKATLRETNRDLQNVATNLARLDSEIQDEEQVVSREDVRSNYHSRTTADVERFNTVLHHRFGDLESLIPRIINERLAAFQATLTKHITKNIDEMRGEYQQGKQNLQDLGNLTFRKVSDVDSNLGSIAKKVYRSFQDINNDMQSAKEEIVYEIGKSTSSSLGELKPVLQQVNQSVAQSVAKAAEGLNITFMEEAARRRGTEDSTRSDYTQFHCPDPTTVEVLQEVKNLLQAVLKRSEDLRRGLNKQTSEGLDLLKLLHQRFSVLVRRMNTEPDQGQKLVAEMKDIGSLVESSYTAVLVAQNAFIDSCKRIQSEEPSFEHKIAEILDKLVTDINLGHKFNRMQLNELKRLVEHLADTNATTSGTFSKVASDEETQEILRTLRDGEELSSETSDKLTEIRATILKTIETANLTASRLENVEQRIESVSKTLVDIDWVSLHQKEPADQLVTAAKDLKGYARDQIIQSLNLHQALLTTLEQITILDETPEPEEANPNDGFFQPPDLDYRLPLYLNDEGHSPPQTQLTLPRTCTVSLLQQIGRLHRLKGKQLSTAAPEGKDTKYEGLDDDYDEENIPAWYTDPDFLSGNYGTPDLGYPVFREDEWRDISDYGSDDYLYIERPSTTEAPALHTTSVIPTTTLTESTTSQPIQPGGVESFFGFLTTPSKRTSKRAIRRTQSKP